jgi:hypothetical protein
VSGRGFIPRRFEQVVFSFLLSMLMTLIVSGISTLRAVGLEAGAFGLWMSNWIASWIVAFPVLLVVAPLVRSLVRRIVRPV